MLYGLYHDFVYTVCAFYGGQICFLYSTSFHAFSFYVQVLFQAKNLFHCHHFLINHILTFPSSCMTGPEKHLHVISVFTMDDDPTLRD